MKKLIFAGLLPLLWLIACNKDKYQDKPQITIKSVSQSVIPVGGSTTIVLSYTDKQGDISDSLYVWKIRLNKTVVKTNRDSFKLKVPDFPDYPKGEINVQMDYYLYLTSAETPPPIIGSNPPQLQPDTLNIKFWLRDKAGNISDTVTAENIIVIR